jgi:hypothetical protein
VITIFEFIFSAKGCTIDLSPDPATVALQQLVIVFHRLKK